MLWNRVLPKKNSSNHSLNLAKIYSRKDFVELFAKLCCSGDSTHNQCLAVFQFCGGSLYKNKDKLFATQLFLHIIVTRFIKPFRSHSQYWMVIYFLPRGCALKWRFAKTTTILTLIYQADTMVCFVGIVHIQMLKNKCATKGINNTA